jgi:hypothetical protein
MSKIPGTLPLSAEQAEWLAGQLPKASTNPCVNLYGPGPTDKKCKDCRLLTYRQCGKRYYKCHLRNITSGPGTDHRMRWPACGRFIQKVD